jgi:hypothetical protein
MDAANKTEKIAAPEGKHDDYCDSSVIALHASLAMLPTGSSFASVNIQQQGQRRRDNTKRTLFAKTRRSKGINRSTLRGI